MAEECQESQDLKRTLLEGLVKQEVLKERERCAKIIEGYIESWEPDGRLHEILRMIRAG